MDPLTHTYHYEFVIIGGGLSGLCAAIAAARHGIHTALIQNRPVLGGNASSEIRMHICGADNHGHRENARETGILEEILLENAYRNPQNSYSVFDTLLWEKAYMEDSLDLYLNTHITHVECMKNRIQSVSGHQLTTEKHLQFYAPYFLDATGDGTIAALSGATYMIGREASHTFGEPHAPKEADNACMGNTLLFTTKKVDAPTPFYKPTWANTYTEEDLNNRAHGAHGFNYWWIEIGGDKLHTIDDSETIRDDLLKALYGVWDHIKNTDHSADYYALDWVGFLPGKRESRRVVGDYILTERDLSQATVFHDAVAYGGWPMDMHVVGGLNTRLDPTAYIHMKDVYTIPYRSLYSKDIDNLLIGGRLISASHMAFGSTRVMGTCAIIGQAIGTSTALLKKYNCMPADLKAHIPELQQLLLTDDLYIPHVQHIDEQDLCLQSTMTASYEESGYEAHLLHNGYSRTMGDSSNMWRAPANDDQWIAAHWDKTVSLSSIHLKFDSNLSQEIMLSLYKGQSNQPKTLPETLVKSFTLDFYDGKALVAQHHIPDNHQRFVRINLESSIRCNRLRIRFHETYGCSDYRLFELRAY